MANLFNQQLKKQNLGLEEDSQETTLAAGSQVPEESQQGGPSPAQAGLPATPAAVPLSPKAKASPSGNVKAEAGEVDPKEKLHKSPENSPEKTEGPQGPITVTCVCMKCNMEKSIDACIKKSKKWICKPCNTAATMLSQACEGGFNGKAFTNLTSDEQQEFWRNAAGASKRDLVASYQSKLRAIRTKEKAEGSTGDFLPLSVWQNKGYDTDAIQKNSLPEDIREHPVLGTTYRVHLEWSSNTSKQGVTEERLGEVQAQHGLCNERASAASNKASAGKDKADQKGKQKAAKLWAQAAKVQAAVSPVLAQHRKTMLENKDNEADGWEDARTSWGELQSIMKDASTTVEMYNKDPDNCQLDPDLVAALPFARSKVQGFTKLIKDLVPKGKKRKQAADGESKWVLDLLGHSDHINLAQCQILFDIFTGWSA